MKKLAIFLAVLFFITPSFLMAQDAKESRFTTTTYSGDFKVIEDKKLGVVCYIAEAGYDNTRTVSMQCFPKAMLMPPAEQLTLTGLKPLRKMP